MNWRTSESGSNRRDPLRSRKNPYPWWTRPGFGSLLVVGAVTAVLGAMGITAFLAPMADELPNLEQLETYEPRLISKVYGRNGELLKELFTERRVQVPLDSISPYVIEAALATEDRNFYEHWGVDPVGIARSVVINLSTMSKKQGASTITQQLARNLYLHLRKTFTRKFKEIMTAVQIERTYAKEEILQMYFTQMYFGHGAYGIQSAAQRYYDKNAWELDLQQSAMLVGLLKAPAYYSPWFHPEDAVRRRNTVLNNMLDFGAIDQAQYEQAKAESLHVVPFEQDEELGIAPYFTEEVRQTLEELQEPFGFDYYRDGLKIYTTLDSTIQSLAEAAIDSHIVPFQEDFYVRFRKEGLEDWLRDSFTDSLVQQGIYDPADTLIAPERVAFLKDSILSLTHEAMRDSVLIDSLLKKNFVVQVAFVAMDPDNGDVLAMVGGRNFREYKFNRAVQALRQPGSVFKPFVYTVAIDNGIYANHKVLNMVQPVKMPDGTWWRPENYSVENRGTYVSLRKALRSSLNNVTVRLVAGEDRLIPVSEVVRYAHRMGIRTHLDAVPSLALGSNGVIPIDVITAYTVFASGGMRATPRYIEHIDDKSDIEITSFSPRREIVLSPETAYIMVNLLEDVATRGTGGSARWKYKFWHPAGGKTGTTNNFTDAWFVGFTPRIVAGVWLGFDDPSKSLGKHQSGSRAALPIWAIFMRELHEEMGWERLEFEQPVGVVSAKICEDSGEKAGPYCPNVYEEIFRRGDEPIGSCSLHRIPGFDS
ncbi:PBP1A family penicillin-binding protein [bacterium]|nr:PBP1A family penicillin-binding protein [bacterium]